MSLATSTEDPAEIFQLLEQLGVGSYGEVYKALNKRTSSIVAVKIVPVGQDYEDMAKEIEILKKCRSKYIVGYEGCYVKDGDIWIVIEYCSGGSIADFMKVCDCTLTEEQIAVVAASILRGLYYLHKNRNIHRDVKAANVLLTHDGRAKLADFGVSATLNNTLSKRCTVIGTPFWMAPEVIEETNYDGKADIWSLGITAIELAEGEPPNSDVHPMRAIFLIPSLPSPRLQDPSRWSPEFVDFISKCLVKDSHDRPTALDLLNHPFVCRRAKELRRLSGKSPVLAELVESGMDRISSHREKHSRSAVPEEEAGEGGEGVLTMMSELPPQRSEEGPEDDGATMLYHAQGTMVEQDAGGTMGDPAFMRFFDDAEKKANTKKPIPFSELVKHAESHEKALIGTFAPPKLTIEQQLGALDAQYVADVEQLQAAYKKQREKLTSLLEGLV